jgi:hypothetical protein
MLSLVLFGSFAQSSNPKAPEDATLPSGKRWNDVIAEEDYKNNLKDARALAELTAGIRSDIEASDKFVLSLKTLRNIDEAEKLLKTMRSRMRKN